MALNYTLNANNKCGAIQGSGSFNKKTTTAEGVADSPISDMRFDIRFKFNDMGHQI